MWLDKQQFQVAANNGTLNSTETDRTQRLREQGRKEVHTEETENLLLIQN